LDKRPAHNKCARNYCRRVDRNTNQIVKSFFVLNNELIVLIIYK